MPLRHRQSRAASAPSKDGARVAPRIIAAAREHFLTHGFRGVTMDDLAAELAVSKKTLYTAFRSKTALVEAVLRTKFLEIERDLKRIVAGGAADFPACLHELLACVQRHAGEIRPPFVRDIRRDAPEVFALVERSRRKLIERHFTRLFNRGRKAGLVRRDISVPVMIEILLGATDAVVNPAKMEELGLPPGAGYSAVISVVLTGVLNARGRVRL